MKKKYYLYSVLFAMYLAILVYFLFFAEGFRENISRAYRYNFVPFREITRYIAYRRTIGYGRAFLNLGGNIIAFMPMGFFLPHLCRKRLNFWSVSLIALEASVLVEVIQLFTRVGCCDIDDVILNTIGGMLGYGCYMMGEGRKKS